MELLAKLGIDWGLLTAQIVNFALLMGVLTIFVYKPLLNLLEDRRARIAKSMEDAERIAKQAQEIKAVRAEAMRTIDRESGLMLESVKKQAEAMKEKILETAQKEGAELLERGKRQLADERSKVFSEVQSILSLLIVRMTEKIIEREFSKADQEKMLQSLQKELPSLLK